MIRDATYLDTVSLAVPAFGSMRGSPLTTQRLAITRVNIACLPKDNLHS